MKSKGNFNTYAWNKTIQDLYQDNQMNTPKLDTVEEQQQKRFNRFLQAKEEMLEVILQLEHDLNYYADYIGSESLFEAKKHATSAYYILKKIGESDE